MSLAIVGGHAIFLDAAADQYFALPAAENGTLLDILAERPVPIPASLALSGAIGVPAESAMLRSLMPKALPPIERATDAVASSPHVSEQAAAIRHLLAAYTLLKLCGLQPSLQRLSRLNKARKRSGAALDRISDAHSWLSQHVTAKDDCLVRSLAFARHARTAGRDVQLVIGVKADPFAAHCWVQTGGHILNDDTDRVAAFRPIVVL